MRLSGEELRDYAEKVRSIEEQLFEYVWKYSSFWEKLFNYLRSRAYRHSDYYIRELKSSECKSVVDSLQGVLDQIVSPVIPPCYKPNFQKALPTRLAYIRFATYQQKRIPEVASLLDFYQETVVTPLVTGHYGLVMNEAKKFATRINYAVEQEDLIQAGLTGLVEAVHRFDFERGNQFSTFAVPWIKTEISDCVTKYLYHAKISDEDKSKVAQYYNTSESEFEEEGYALSAEVKDLFNSASCMNLTSLDSSVYDDEQTTFHSVVPDPTSGDSFLQFAQETAWNTVVARAKVLLTDTEWVVLRHRFGLFGAKILTLKQVGDMIGKSDEYVRCIEKQIIAKLKRDEIAFEALKEIKQILTEYEGSYLSY